MNQRTVENFPIAGELYGWCSTVTAADLAEGSIGRRIFDAQTRGEIPEGSAGHIIHQYLGAGVDTTIASIGNIIALFGRHPEQFELVRQDPLVPSHSPRSSVLATGARLGQAGHARHVEIDDATVPAGAQVAILFGASSHDERHHDDDPDRFDVTGNPVDHLLRLQSARLRRAGAGADGGPRDHRSARDARAVLPHRRRGARSEQHHANIDRLDVLDVVPAELAATRNRP